MLTTTLLNAVMTVAIGAAPSESLAGDFATESIESSPALIRGSAAISIAREPGSATYRATVVDMKSFGVELADPPEMIRLSGQLSSSRDNGLPRETLNLLGTYKSTDAVCFLRLHIKESAPKLILAAGWLNCGRKKVEIGFTAHRASLVSRDGIAAAR